MLIKLTQYTTGNSVYVSPGSIARILLLQEEPDRNGKTVVYFGSGAESGFLYSESPAYIKEEIRKIKEKEIEDLAEKVASKLKPYILSRGNY